MTNPNSSLSIEEKLVLANRMLPDSEYLNRLHGMFAKLPEDKISFSQQLKLALRRPAWIVTIILIVLLVAGTLIIGPQRVYAEVAKLFGYISGVGFVDQNETVRVLAEPVSVTRDGITVTVAEATLTKEKTRVMYKIENTPDSAFSHYENENGCSEQAYLLLSTGVTLRPKDGWGSEFSNNNDFAPIPEEIMDATLVLPCIWNTLPGMAPENWEIPLHFTIAPPDMTVAPVIDMATPTAQVFPSTAEVNTTEVSNDPYGIVLSLDQVIPLTDGYYLVGHTEWKDRRIAEVFPAGWDMKAYDVSGQEVPIEPAEWDAAGILPGSHQWLYKLFGASLNGPITLRATEMSIVFAQPIEFPLDLQNQGFDGSDAQIDKAWLDGSTVINVPGFSAIISQIKFIQQGDLKGFELIIQADPVLQQLPVNFTKGLDFSGLEMISGGGGSNRDSTDGLLKTTILTNAKITFPLILSSSTAAINGSWETTWNPPLINKDPLPTPMLQACLTLEQWRQALNTPVSIADLQGLPQRVLISRGALAPEPSLFLANLDGSNEQGLVFGNGSLSTDASKLVYADQFGNIFSYDIATANETVLTHDNNDNIPFISPDGKQIAFTRRGDDQQIYVIKADGSDLKTLVPGINHPLAWGWTPDSSQILFWTITGERSSLIQLVDPQTGEISKLFAVNSETPEPVFSHDGKWIAYLDRVPGRMAEGLFVAHPDGTNSRLIVQLDYWQLGGKIRWTPDGKWLSFSVLNSDVYSPTSTAGLVNLDTCEVISLPQLNGTIQDWVGQWN